MFIMYLFLIAIIVFWIILAMYFYYQYKTLQNGKPPKITPKIHSKCLRSVPKATYTIEEASGSKFIVEQHLRDLLLSKTNFVVLMYNINKPNNTVGNTHINILRHLSKYNIRHNDFCHCYENDKFIIILENIDFQNALLVANRICDNVRERKKFTIAMGLTCYDSSFTNAEDVINSANIALSNAEQKYYNRSN